MTDEAGYGFVLRHLLRSNENTLLFFSVITILYDVKIKNINYYNAIVYYYIIFYLNISTSPLFLTIYAQIIEKKIILLQAR